MSVSLLHVRNLRMKAFNASKQKTDCPGIDSLRDLLMRLVETRSHELPEEALRSKAEIRDYFLSKQLSK